MGPTKITLGQGGIHLQLLLQAHRKGSLCLCVWKQLQLIYLVVGRDRKCYARLIYESKVSEVSHQVVVQCKKCYQTTDARPCLMPLIVKRQLRKQQNNLVPDIFIAGLATLMGSHSMLLAPEAAGRFSYSVGTCEF